LSLPGGQIHLWRVGLDQPPAQIECLKQSLSPDERERAERFHFERDRRRFVVGRGGLRLILGRYLGLEPDRLRFDYGPRGKPALAEISGGEGRLCFNLAHSGEVAVYALVRDQEIGVDVEQIRLIIEMEQIARRFFATPEQAALLALPLEQRQAAFFNCWTRKEAYLKALGDGLARPLDQFWVSLTPGEPARLVSVAGDSGESSHWLIEAFSPAAGYVAAVAVRGQHCQFSYWDLFQSGI
jgi:4'-phosphopantetheinyl transferase